MKTYEINAKSIEIDIWHPLGPPLKYPISMDSASPPGTPPQVGKDPPGGRRNTILHASARSPSLTGAVFFSMPGACP